MQIFQTDASWLDIIGRWALMAAAIFVCFRLFKIGRRHGLAVPPDAQFFAGLLGPSVPFALAIAVMHAGTWITGSSHLGETAALVVMFTLGAWYLPLVLVVLVAAFILTRPEASGELAPDAEGDAMSDGHGGT